MERQFVWTDGEDHYGSSPNPSYEPEACGLEKLQEWEAGESYEFDTLIFWRDKETGNIYCGKDSGCSCPTPFESVRGLDDLTFCPTIEVAKAQFDEWNKDYDNKFKESSVDAHKEIESFFESKSNP